MKTLVKENEELKIQNGQLTRERDDALETVKVRDAKISDLEALLR